MERKSFVYLQPICLRKRYKKEKGLLLVELLWGMLLGSIILSAFLVLLRESYVLYDRTLDKLDTWQNAHYARQAITSRIRFSLEQPKLTNDSSGIWLGNKTGFHFCHYGYQLYRQLSDGDLQPYTGTAIAKKASRIKVEPLEGKMPFSQEGKSCFAYHWIFSSKEKAFFLPIEGKINAYLTYYEELLKL